MTEPCLVILAAGMGSRFGGLKQITAVDDGGHAIIDFSLYDAYRAGFRKVVFVIKHAIEADFRAAVADRMAKYFDVRLVFQELDRLPEGFSVPADRVKPWGTAHATLCAADEVDGPFAVINADDFYGAEAFRCLYDYLKDAQDDDKYRYCMVGYRVENTLTENGTVSRGICEADADGYLTDIVERTAISRGADGVISDPEAGEIAEGTLVSMNMWGFTPSFLDELEDGLKTFMQTELPNNPQKGEYYLPFAVDHLIRTGRATARVLQTAAQWYGVTYQEDKPVVVDALRRMTEAGLYPAE